MTDRNNLNKITDSLFLGELNQANAFTVFVDFEENALNYILYIENTKSADTLTKIAYNRKADCNRNIQDLNYKFNGELWSETKLVAK
jgi:hypothetical protein